MLADRDANKNLASATTGGTMSGVSFTTAQDSENRLIRWTRTNGEDQSWAFGTRVKNLPGFARPANRLSCVGLHRRPAAGPPASTSLSASPLDRARADGILSTRVPSFVGDWNSTADNQATNVSTTTAYVCLTDASGMGQVISEYETGGLVRHTTYGSYVDEPLSLHVKAGVNAGNTYWYHQDRQYNVIGLTDASGAVVERYAYTAYTAYGARRVLDPNGTTERSYSAYGNARGHQGLWHDDESGLIYNRARYRSSVLGRWMGRDGLGYVDGVNLYERIRSRVFFGADPSGFYSYYDLYNSWYAAPTPQTQINGLIDAVSHYRSKAGGTVHAGSGVISEIRESHTYQENVLDEDGSLQSRIRDKLESVSKAETSGELSAGVGSTVGNLDTETLGSFKFDVSYRGAWTAGPWKKRWHHAVSGSFYRELTMTMLVILNFNDPWDFESNPEYGMFKNFMRETGPGFIAGDGLKFNIAGAMVESVTIEGVQSK